MMQKSAKYWIGKLNLIKHPEGGWFREVYRSGEIASESCLPKEFNGDRNFSTSIYFLLEKEDISVLHRIKSDEIWHFYDGGSDVEIISLKNGTLQKQFLGREFDKGENLQVVVPKNTWFGARLINQKSYALVGCTVSPGFDFNDFEIAGNSLLREYPEFKDEFSFFAR